MLSFPVMDSSARLPRQVPVFPLPGVVLFPKALLPLRVFEPRYLAMMRDILDSHGCMAMALFKPGWEEDYFGSPAVFPTIGLGRVLEYEHAGDGTYRIVLLGEHRARIQGWVDGRPYRVAQVDLIPEEEPAGDEREGLRDRLRTYLHRLLESAEGIDAEARKEIDRTVDAAEEVGFLVDTIAHHFLEDPREKQALLEERNALRRERRLKEFLVRHARIEEDGEPPCRVDGGGT